MKNADGDEFTYRAQYMVGAGGGRTVGQKIGVEMEGFKNLAM
jgi:2,4-dichlorophenol 6-monooxygenase